MSFTSHFLVCFWDNVNEVKSVFNLNTVYILLIFFLGLIKKWFIYLYILYFTHRSDSKIVLKTQYSESIDKGLPLYFLSQCLSRLSLPNNLTCWIISFPQTSELLNFLISDFLRWRRLVNYFCHHRQQETVGCIITSGWES